MTNVSDNSQKSPFLYSSLFWHPQYEVWKPIIGYEGYYEISNYGRVKSLSRYKNVGKFSHFTKEKMLALCKTKGYLRVFLRNNDTAKSQSVHRLVAMAFIPNPENKPSINHKDCHRNNNRVDNIEWCTAKENTAHALSLNRMKPCKNNSEKQRQDISIRSKRPVAIYDKTNKLIKIFPSSIDCAKYLNASYATVRVCKTNKKTIRNYIVKNYEQHTK